MWVLNGDLTQVPVGVGHSGGADNMLGLHELGMLMSTYRCSSRFLVGPGLRLETRWFNMNCPVQCNEREENTNHQM